MLGLKFGSKPLNLFAGLLLEGGGGSFSPRLSLATVIVGPVLHLQCQCQADPQA